MLVQHSEQIAVQIAHQGLELYSAIAGGHLRDAVGVCAHELADPQLAIFVARLLEPDQGALLSSLLAKELLPRKQLSSSSGAPKALVFKLPLLLDRTTAPACIAVQCNTVGLHFESLQIHIPNSVPSCWMTGLQVAHRGRRADIPIPDSVLSS